MVGDEVHYAFQPVRMRPLDEGFPFVEPFVDVLRQVRVDVVVVAYGVWAASLPFDYVGVRFVRDEGVVCRRSMADDASVPYVRDTQGGYFVKCDIGYVVELPASVLVDGPAFFAGRVGVGEQPREQLVYYGLGHNIGLVSLYSLFIRQMFNFVSVRHLNVSFVYRIFYSFATHSRCLS